MTSETRQRQWQRQKAAEGRCIICGQVQARGVYCLKHYNARRDRVAARREESGEGTGRRNQCSVCQEEGHNKRSCPIAAKQSA